MVDLLKGRGESVTGNPLSFLHPPMVPPQGNGRVPRPRESEASPSIRVSLATSLRDLRDHFLVWHWLFDMCVKSPATKSDARCHRAQDARLHLSRWLAIARGVRGASYWPPAVPPLGGTKGGGKEK